MSNIDVIHVLLYAFAEQTGKPEEAYARLITFVADGLEPDRRYALDGQKLHDQLGSVTSAPVRESLE